MASTNVPIGSALARKLYSVALFAQTIRRPSFRRNLTGTAPKQTDAERKLRGQTSSDYPFVRVTDLTKTAGDTVSVDMFDIIRGKPIMGDRKLSGKGMALSYASMDIRIDQTRGMVDPGGRMTQKRTLHNLRKVSLANLAGWNSRLEDQLCLIHVGGARGTDDGVDWVVPLTTDPDFSDIVVNSINAPSRNRRFFGGNATTASDIDTSDDIKLDDIDRLRATLDELVFPLQPIMLQDSYGKMDPEAEENPLFCMFLSSRAWHRIKTNTTDPAWRTFLANAHARSNGFDHPLFKGTTGLWNGILIKKMARAIRFDAGATVQELDASDVEQPITAAVATDRAILLGAQALAMVYGSHSKSGYHYNWHEEETDHGNTVEVSTAMMGGKSKLRFQVIAPDGSTDLTDHGVMTMDGYAPAV
jgi:N4-gp56 family major capsid protein